MRGARSFLLVAIVAIFGGVLVTYVQQKKTIKAASPARPQSLPDDLNFVGEHSTWSEKSANSACEKYLIGADSHRQTKDSARLDMRGVELKLFSKDCKSYNLVKTAEATYFTNEHRFYSEGQVEITLSVPMQGESKHQLVSIKTAGVTLNTDNGHADTDQWAIFSFENGDGTATGATYDPDSHMLQLKKDVIVHRHPPEMKAMTIEGGSLTYNELSGEVRLAPWGKFTRENTVVEGENPIIKLRNREYIQQVHATHARGTDTYPTRKLQYSADDMMMDFDEKGEIQKITGEGNGHLLNTGDTAVTTVDGNHVEMNFSVVKKESLLTRVAASGQASAEAKPLPVPGKEIGETHVLRSDNFEMNMRPGGKEIERVLTHAPGTLEFVPNLPVQHHRVLSGNDMLIAYGPKNHIDSFHATDVKTSTDPNADEKKHGRTAPSITSSRELAASFAPNSSTLTTMEQQGSFTYDQGDRHARAQHASLDNGKNVMLLESSARLWDSTGSTNADRIRIDERSGDFVADGNVKSSRLPEKDSKKNGQLLNGDDPLQAQADHMESMSAGPLPGDRNTIIHYQGKAMMWQGANRIEADKIDLNRKTRGLVADGSVVSNLWEQPKEDEKKKGAKSVLTMVRAPHMVYTDENRLAVYSGGVQLTRTGTVVNGKELKAYMAAQGADSRLEKAYADGDVKIVQTVQGRTRTGTADHSEYYTDDNRVVLRGGTPTVIDSVSGKMGGNGTELIYRADDGSLQGTGSDGNPVQSRMIRNKKKK
ncbi:MAG TPA: LptA/OstA family protein [Bryobacteraceae bacterium]|nr:LptA/OstA family protein [Bryobacteraceae bacterium]